MFLADKVSKHIEMSNSCINCQKSFKEGQYIYKCNCSKIRSTCIVCAYSNKQKCKFCLFEYAIDRIYRQKKDTIHLGGVSSSNNRSQRPIQKAFVTPTQQQIQRGYKLSKTVQKIKPFQERSRQIELAHKKAVNIIQDQMAFSSYYNKNNYSNNLLKRSSQNIQKKSNYLETKKQKPFNKTYHQQENKGQLFGQSIRNDRTAKSSQMNELNNAIKNIEIQKMYFDHKCRKNYFLFQLAKALDLTAKEISIVMLPSCQCIRGKQFIGELLRDRCLHCGKQQKIGSYHLKNGLVVCDQCLTRLFNKYERKYKMDQKQQKCWNYIERLFIQCFSCTTILKSRKQVAELPVQMDVSQSEQQQKNNQIIICKKCFQTSKDKLKQYDQYKQVALDKQQINYLKSQKAEQLLYEKRLQKAKKLSEQLHKQEEVKKKLQSQSKTRGRQDFTQNKNRNQKQKQAKKQWKQLLKPKQCQICKFSLQPQRDLIQLDGMPVCFKCRHQSLLTQTKLQKESNRLSKKLYQYNKQQVLSRRQIKQENNFVTSPLNVNIHAQRQSEEVPSQKYQKPKTDHLSQKNDHTHNLGEYNIAEKPTVSQSQKQKIEQKLRQKQNQLFKCVSCGQTIQHLNKVGYMEGQITVCKQCYYKNLNHKQKQKQQIAGKPAKLQWEQQQIPISQDKLKKQANIRVKQSFEQQEGDQPALTKFENNLKDPIVKVIKDQMPNQFDVQNKNQAQKSSKMVFNMSNRQRVQEQQTFNNTKPRQSYNKQLFTSQKQEDPIKSAQNSHITSSKQSQLDNIRKKDEQPKTIKNEQNSSTQINIEQFQYILSRQLREDIANRNQSMKPERDSPNATVNKQIVPFDVSYSQIRTANNQSSMINARNPLDQSEQLNYNMIIKCQKEENHKVELMQSNELIKQENITNKQNQELFSQGEFQIQFNQKLQIQNQDINIKGIPQYQYVKCSECKYQISQDDGFTFNSQSKPKQIGLKNDQMVLLCRMCYYHNVYQVQKNQKQKMKNLQIEEKRQKYKSADKRASTTKKFDRCKDPYNRQNSVRKTKVNQRQYKAQNIVISKPMQDYFSDPIQMPIQLPNKGAFVQQKLNLNVLVDYDAKINEGLTGVIRKRLEKTSEYTNQSKKLTQLTDQNLAKQHEVHQRQICMQCHKQNTILCFGKLCLDCFKKQK